jgi:hypothetical protein
LNRQYRDFTLGQFFDLWKTKLNNPQIFDNIFNKSANSIPQIYINGNKLPNGPNYRDVKLHAHDQIALIYGIPPTNIPSKYVFAQGLWLKSIILHTLADFNDGKKW